MDLKNGNLYLCIIFVLSKTFASCESANVLFIGLYMSGSHMMAFIPVGRSLVDRGHRVTFLVSDIYTHKYSKPEYTNYFTFEHYSCPHLDRHMAEVNDGLGELVAENDPLRQRSMLVSWFVDFNLRNCEAIFSNKMLMERFDDVDAVVVDIAWPCGIYIKSFLSKNKSAPVRGIVISPAASNTYLLQLAGSPIRLSYQAMPMSGFTHPMSFLQRVNNLFLYLLGTNKPMSYILFSKPYHAIVDKYDLDPDMKSSIHEHVDIYLTNTEFAVESPYPLTPNIIPVGGLTARPAEPLQEELESFMQSSAEDGIIVFSLGSNFTLLTKSKPDLVNHFIAAFGRLPQKVLFHLQADPPEHLPENIKVLPWLPLQDVLGHPKTRLFVYHGGNNGFLEAVYHGVPMVIMPLVVDQLDNALKVETMELGTTIDKNRLDADYICKKVTETLQNPEYSKNVKRASAIFKDRPMSAPDTAAFWIEHVIKHGSSYMRSPAHDLSFVQYYLLDVMSLLILTSITILYLGYRIVRCCICCCLGSCRKEKSKCD